MESQAAISVETCDWMNVQDTVKNLLIQTSRETQYLSAELQQLKSSISGARSQSDELASIRREMDEMRRDFCLKSYASDLDSRLREKGNTTDIQEVDSKLAAVDNRVGTLSRSLESHQRDLAQLHSKVDIIRDELAQQRESDTHFIKQCIEDRIMKFEGEMDDKMRAFFASKQTASGKPVDYERLEGLIRAMNLQVQDVKMFSDKMITKDEFRLAICNKADIEDIQNFGSDMGERVAKLEKHTVSTSHVKALGKYYYLYYY